MVTDVDNPNTSRAVRRVGAAHVRTDVRAPVLSEIVRYDSRNRRTTTF
jgi:hypothetical protein